MQAEIPILPDDIYSVEQIREGDNLYHAQCASCHGGIGVPSEVAIVAPDLRLMSLDTHSDMENIVIAGAREQQGMPDFEGAISGQQLESIRAFVVDQARRLQEYQQQNQETTEAAVNEEALNRA